MNKQIEKSFILGFIISVLVMMTGFIGQCENISDRVFRLHILANSDSEEDQLLKMKVRNRIIEYSQNIFEKAENKLEAQMFTDIYLEEIREIAQKEIYDQGFDYPVSVELTNMYFNTRHYNNVTLPAGNYDALRILIGEGKGRNWWCVMFPPMCLPVAEEKQELAEVLNKTQMGIVTNVNEPKYEIRFKCVEMYESFRSNVNRLFSNACNKIDCVFTQFYNI